MTATYAPELPAGRRRILLLLPCTKTKPYPFSVEHKRINQTLLKAGFRPTGPLALPRELLNALEPDFAPEVLNLSPLADSRGTVIHRVVISEPLGVVPYEHIISYEGKPSPACAYGDPGLFENRGNAVSPWRRGGDGFLIKSPFRNNSRRYTTEITDGLVPALQRRGLMRTQYTQFHLRDTLREF